MPTIVLKIKNHLVDYTRKIHERKKVAERKTKSAYLKMFGKNDCARLARTLISNWRCDRCDRTKIICGSCGTAIELLAFLLDWLTSRKFQISRRHRCTESEICALGKWKGKNKNKNFKYLCRHLSHSSHPRWWADELGKCVE